MSCTPDDLRTIRDLLARLRGDGPARRHELPDARGTLEYLDVGLSPGTSLLLSEIALDSSGIEAAALLHNLYFARRGLPASPRALTRARRRLSKSVSRLNSRLKAKGAVVVWHKGVLTLREIEPAPSPVDRCRVLLLWLLRGGARAVHDVRTVCTAHGISMKVYHAALRQLGLRSRPRGFGGRHFLPGVTPGQD